MQRGRTSDPEEQGVGGRQRIARALIRSAAEEVDAWRAGTLDEEQAAENLVGVSSIYQSLLDQYRVLPAHRRVQFLEMMEDMATVVQALPEHSSAEQSRPGLRNASRSRSRERQDPRRASPEPPPPSPPVRGRAGAAVGAADRGEGPSEGSSATACDVSCDVSCFSQGAVEGLPDCSWPQFCAAVGIDQPGWAQEFLRCLAGHYRTSATRELPESVLDQARAAKKDPFVLWVWMLTPDYRGELEGMNMVDDPHVPDNYYLLNVMRKHCKDSPKDWIALTDSCVHDKNLYHQVKLHLARLAGLQGILQVEIFED